jgi:death-on-curing protein
MAAAYLFHIAQNHPFVDGNKRAAVMSALAFLLANGVELSLAPPDLEAMTRKVAGGELSKEKLTKWMHSQIGKGK